MMLTRTRLIVIGIVALLVVLSIACSAALDDGTSESEEPATSGVSAGDDLAALPPGEALEQEQLLAERSYDGASAEAPAGAPAEEQRAPDAQLPGLLDRKIIQSTSVDIEVEDVGKDFQEIVRIAETAGGFVASSTFSNVDDQQVADLTIRVPADRYQGVLAQIRGMGEVQQESSDANDVTEEFTDLQARLRTLEATERRYLELLGQADKINEILQVQDRLDGVRGQIEQVQGRINMLEHLTDLATITAHLRPLAAAAEPPAADGGPHPLEAAAAAWERSLDALRGLATGVLVVVVFSWWLVPPLAVAGFAARWWLSRRPRPATEVST